MNNMTEILILVSIITPIISGLTEAIKKSVNIPLNVVPVVSLVLGLLVGFAAQPVSDLETTLRLWAGGLAGLAATGLYEVVKQREGESKGGEQ